MMNAVIQSNFIPFVAAKLNILRGDTEAETNWSFRVLYSVTGLNMLSSLYDYDENLPGDNAERSVSMQRVKERGEELLEAFHDLFRAKADFLATKENVVQEIIDVYKQTGFILEKNYRFGYPPAVEIAYYGTRIIRGTLPWRVQNMSGLAPYVPDIAAEGCAEWLQAFGIEELAIKDWWRRLLEHCRWQVIERLPINVEYINYHRKNKEKYWLSQCVNTEITMYRDQLPGAKKYGLLRLENGKIELCPLSSWLVNAQEYLRIAIALRNEAGNCPTAQFVQDGAIVYVRLNYLLPPNERSFLELISWPDKRPSHDRRVIPACYGEEVKGMLKNLGYRVLEE
jgi:hypothetical protein